MVAGHIVPRHTDVRDRTVQTGEQGQVVKHHVAERDAERGVEAHELLNHVVGDVVDLPLVARLRVAEDQDVVLVRFGTFDEREVDGGRQGAGRNEAAVLEFGRAGLRVDIVELWNLIGGDGRHPVAWLDHEDDGLVADRNFISAVHSGGDDLAAIGDKHLGHAGLAGVARAVAVLIVEYHAARDGGICRWCAEGERPHAAGRGEQHLFAASCPIEHGAPSRRLHPMVPIDLRLSERLTGPARAATDRPPPRPDCGITNRNRPRRQARNPPCVHRRLACA